MCLAKQFFPLPQSRGWGQRPATLAALLLGLMGCQPGHGVAGPCVSHCRLTSLSLFLWQRGAKNSKREDFPSLSVSSAKGLLVKASDEAKTRVNLGGPSKGKYRDIWTHWRRCWDPSTTAFSSLQELLWENQVSGHEPSQSLNQSLANPLLQSGTQFWWLVLS